MSASRFPRYVVPLWLLLLAYAGAAWGVLHYLPGGAS